MPAGATRLECVFSGKIESALVVNFKNLYLDFVANGNNVFNLFNSFFSEL